jgi:hypothetical protein
VKGATFDDGLDKTRFLAPRSSPISALLLMSFIKAFIATPPHLCTPGYYGYIGLVNPEHTQEDLR